jgi:hypothetical protein
MPGIHQWSGWFWAQAIIFSTCGFSFVFSLSRWGCGAREELGSSIKGAGEPVSGQGVGWTDRRSLEWNEGGRRRRRRVLMSTYLH